jgi:hypothetical protein
MGGTPIDAKPPPGFALPALPRVIHNATKDGTRTGRRQGAAHAKRKIYFDT